MTEGKRVAARIKRICAPLLALAMLLSACAGNETGDQTVNSEQNGTPAQTRPIGDATADPEAATPCIVQTRFETDDVVVADVIATAARFGADPSGEQDSTAAIQSALDECAAAGGGTVWLPAGQYRVTSGIKIPAFVTLRGDWQDPDEGSEYGTVILAEVESIDAPLPALFTLGGSGGAVGLTVYYPEQDLGDVKPYPFTFYVNGQGADYMLQTVKNCTILNGYRGLGACVAEDNAHEMMTVDTLKGTLLHVGAEAYNQADVGTWKNVDLGGRFWAAAGKAYNAPSVEAIEAYTRANGTGLILGDLEWTEFYNLKISGYRTGIEIVKGKRIQFAGSLYGVWISGCQTGLRVSSIDARWGMLVACGRIEGTEYAVDNQTRGVVKLAGVELGGALNGERRIRQDESGTALTLPNAPAAPNKPLNHLYVVSADRSGASDAAPAIQESLDEAGRTGGIVYLPAGKYLLETPLRIPAGVELRGCSSVAAREQSGLSLGTVLLAAYGETAAGSDPAEAEALITMTGGNAGVRGLRIFYIRNDFTEGVKEYSYAIRSRHDGAYAVNIGLTAATYGVDFRGSDGHVINKLVGCCYRNAILVGESTGGVIEGCLQNGTAIYRNGLDVGYPRDEATIWDQLFDPVTRLETVYIRLENAADELVFNTFAYGVRTLAEAEGCENLRLINIGADNLGSATPLLKTAGGSVTAVNMMRYNGKSYENEGSRLAIFNRITIGAATEQTVIEP